MNSLDYYKTVIPELFKNEANLNASIMPWDEETDTWEDIAERAFIKGANFGFNKANEWHYVKDELPPCGEDVLQKIGKKDATL